MDLSKCRRSLERLKAYYEDRLQMLLRLFRYTDWDTRDRSEYREFLVKLDTAADDTVHVNNLLKNANSRYNKRR